VGAKVLLEAETLEPRADPVESFFAFIPSGEGGDPLMAKREGKAQTFAKGGESVVLEQDGRPQEMQTHHLFGAKRAGEVGCAKEGIFSPFNQSIIADISME
jgi:hypothetical protein